MIRSVPASLVRLAIATTFAAVALPALLGWPVSGLEGAQGSSDTTKVRIRAVEYAFKPAHPRVPAGRIRFRTVNRGSVRHALAIKTPRGVVRTPNIAPGQSASLRV